MGCEVSRREVRCAHLFHRARCDGKLRALLRVVVDRHLRDDQVLANLLDDVRRGTVGGPQPGDFGFDPLKLMTPENEVKYKTAELTHGRLCMLAFGGIVTQAALGHPSFPYV